MSSVNYQFLMDVWRFDAFLCPSSDATQRMYLYPSCYGKVHISLWPETDFWCFIGGSAVRRSYPETKQNTCAAVQQQQAFPSICPISLTFIGGDAHVDSCILMSTAFGWRVSSRVASWGEGPQSGVNSELFSGSADAALSGQDNTFSVVCPLSYSMCVKPKTTVSWRTQGNGYRCNVAEDFPLLCIGVYHSCAVMCPLSRL